MPLYDFEASDGSAVEIHFSMADAPPIGSTIERDGETLIRVPSATPTLPVWKPYISNRLPRNLEGVACTPAGKPIIDSQATERRVASMLGWERE